MKHQFLYFLIYSCMCIHLIVTTDDNFNNETSESIFYGSRQITLTKTSPGQGQQLLPHVQTQTPPDKNELLILLSTMQKLDIPKNSEFKPDGNPAFWYGDSEVYKLFLQESANKKNDGNKSS